MTRDKLIDRLNFIDVMIRARHYKQAKTDLRILQQAIQREHKPDLSPVDDEHVYDDPPGFEDDGDALASAGFDTDEDYGG